MAAATAILIVFSSGCTADRSAEAERIRDEVQTMPGVSSSSVSYINDFENGANLRIRLDMADASEAQIGAVAQRIDALKGAAFDDHRQSLEISVADFAALDYQARRAPSAVATDARVLRAVRAQADAGTIQWQYFDGQSRLEMWDATTPDSDLRTALRELTVGEAAPEVVYVRSASPAHHSSWEVTMPLTVAQMDAIARVRDALPVVVYHVDVGAGRISGLSVNLGASSLAFGNTMAMVGALEPSKAHPVVVEWRLADAAPADVGQFTACSSGADQATAAAPVTGFADLKVRFEAQFGGCDE